MNILWKNVKIPKNPVDLSAISEMLKYASLGICAFSYTSVGSGVPSPKYHVALTILNASGEVSISSASSSVSMVYFWLAVEKNLTSFMFWIRPRQPN